MTELSALKLWQEKFRELAETGFIPYAKYMKPLLPKVKYDNWTAMKCNLEAEGWVFKEIEFGWIVIEKEDREIALWKKQIAICQEKIAKKQAK